MNWIAFYMGAVLGIAVGFCWGRLYQISYDKKAHAETK